MGRTITPQSPVYPQENILRQVLGFRSVSREPVANVKDAPCVPTHKFLPGRPVALEALQDAQLVQQCLQGDGSAWEELVRRHTRRIFNICYRFTGNRTESEDLSQDVFLRVYRTLASYRSAHGGFPTWMTSVTRNLLIDHYRRTKRDRITDSLDDKMPAVENKQSSARRPDEQALLGELGSQVQSALTKLSPELREAVILRDLQQLEYSEIQTVLSVPEGTVKSRINRGRIELARILQQMGVRPS